LNFLHNPIKNLCSLQRGRKPSAQHLPTKKPALMTQVRAVKFKENLKRLKN